MKHLRTIIPNKVKMKLPRTEEECLKAIDKCKAFIRNKTKEGLNADTQAAMFLRVGNVQQYGFDHAEADKAWRSVARHEEKLVILGKHLAVLRTPYLPFPEPIPVREVVK